MLTVPESLAAGIRIREFAEGAPLTIDEQGKMIGCLRALAKTDAEQFPECDRVPMRRAIAFCNLVKSSQRLEERIHDVAEAYAATYGNGHAPAVSARHVDGTFNATARGDALAFLEEAPEGETRILTNARCLTGERIAALEAVGEGKARTPEATKTTERGAGGQANKDGPRAREAESEKALQQKSVDRDLGL